jgi:hypothetical protein
VASTRLNEHVVTLALVMRRGECDPHLVADEADREHHAVASLTERRREDLAELSAERILRAAIRRDARNELTFARDRLRFAAALANPHIATREAHRETAKAEDEDRRAAPNRHELRDHERGRSPENPEAERHRRPDDRVLHQHRAGQNSACETLDGNRRSRRRVFGSAREIVIRGARARHRLEDGWRRHR